MRNFTQSVDLVVTIVLMNVGWEGLPVLLARKLPRPAQPTPNLALQKTPNTHMNRMKNVLLTFQALL